MSENNSIIDLKFKERLYKNTISGILNLLVSVIIGLGLIPFFINTLGNSTYALIPLATSITSYVLIIIDCLNGSVSRYLTVDLQKSDIISANKVFNTTIIGTFIISILLIPIILIISLMIPSFFDISNSNQVDVFFLFFLIFASSLIRCFGSSFMTTLFAYNRMDLRNIVNISNQVIFVVFIIISFIFCGPSLILIGLSYIISAIISVFISYIFSKKICSFLIINIKQFSKTKFIELIRMSFWLIISRFGGLLGLNVSLILVNIFYGVVAETYYSLPVTWITYIISVGSMITSMITPMTYSYYSKNDIIGLTKFCKFSMKVVGLLMSLPIALICIFSTQIITIWVGVEYISVVPLFWLLIIPTLQQIMVTCIGTISMAYVKVRIPALTGIIVGGCNIFFAYLFYNLMDIGFYSVAIAYIFTTIIIGIFIINPLYHAYIIGVKLGTFLKPTLYCHISLSLLLIFGVVVTSIINIDDISILILCIFGLSTTYIVIILKFCFNNLEKKLIRSCIPTIIEKNIPKWIL